MTLRVAERILDLIGRTPLLRPGSVIIEPAAGNAGIGLALIGRRRVRW